MLTEPRLRGWGVVEALARGPVITRLPSSPKDPLNKLVTNLPTVFRAGPRFAGVYKVSSTSDQKLSPEQ